MSLVWLCYTIASHLPGEQTGNNYKPVPVLEMWMALTHLAASLLTCILQALFSLSIPVIAEAQSALFLGVSLTVTLASLACMQVKPSKHS